MGGKDRPRVVLPGAGAGGNGAVFSLFGAGAADPSPPQGELPQQPQCGQVGTHL